MYANDLNLCGESNEDLRAMVLLRCVGEKGMKVNAGKIRVMVLGGEVELKLRFA